MTTRFTLQLCTFIVFASLALTGACRNKEEKPPATTENTAANDTAANDEPGDQAPPLRFTVYVNEHELWAGCAGDASGASCPAAQKVAACDGAMDTAALSASLCDMARSATNARYVDIEISAPKDARLQRLVSVMDAINKAGFRRVAMVSTESMAAKLPGDATSPTAPARCGQEPPVCDAPVVVRDIPPPPVALAQQPLLIISTEQIRLDKTDLASLEDFLADPGKALPGIQAALEKARQQSGSTSIIVQADKNTVAEVLMPVLDAAKAVGFDDVVYAVNKTPAGTE